MGRDGLVRRGRRVVHRPGPRRVQRRRLAVVQPSHLQALPAQGGWGEVYVYFTDKFHLHTGYGLDSPRRADLAPTQFARNQTYYANWVYDASKALQLSFEVDYRKTDYIAFDNARGAVFLTQLLWRF